MLPSVTMYGVRGQSKYEVVVRVGSILFGKISAHPWCTGTILGYSITQVSNRIFTIKCRQSSSATATHLATSLTVSIHSLKKFVRMSSAKKSYFMQITRFSSHNNESIYLSLESVLIVDDLKQSLMPL